MILTRLTIGLVMRVVRSLIILFFTSSLLAVVYYKYFPVKFTPLMAIRCCQQAVSGHIPHCSHTWVPLDDMSIYMPVAVMASEDQRFLKHSGFDLDEISKAVRDRQNGTRKRGASTISQQTAKNVFLWPSSTWVRKGFEVYFTFLIEHIWGKHRIMEVYLNSIEMGDGLYGAEAVARANFGTSASDLSRPQCALIAATLPNPLKYSSASPSSYMYKRQSWILHQMRYIPVFGKE